MSISGGSASWENWDFGAHPAVGEEEFTPQQAGQQLVDVLIDLKLAGRINATMACIISYWAAKAGAQGPCSQLGQRPDQGSGQYSRHFDKFTDYGVRSMGFYQLPVARRLKVDLGRRWDPLPFLPPHEMLLDELLLDDTAEPRFQEELESEKKKHSSCVFRARSNG